MPKAAFPFCCLFFLLVLCAPACAQFSLEAIEKLVQHAFPLVANITWQDLKQKITSSDSAHYLLFDTRPVEEYHTSHIRCAVQIDPEMPAQEFLETYGDTLKGRHAVFYCSVGYRSSRFAQRVQQELLAGGARSVANLRGGIFRWYNEANPVVDARGETDNIHPYDAFWRMLVRDRNKAKDSAAEKPLPR